MTKKSILLLSAGGLIAAYLTDFFYKNNILVSRNVFNLILPTLFLFSLPLLIFSLITYKMREEVFRSWLHFAYWWIPLSIVLTLLTPDGSGSWGIPTIDSEFVAIVFASLFTLISLLIIVWRYFRTRNIHI
jgi:hypothetical protein